jgi:uncharacterized membrane protein YfcA
VASTAMPVADRVVPPAPAPVAPSRRGRIVPAALVALALLLVVVAGPPPLARDLGAGRFVALTAILFLAGLMSGMCGFGFGASGALSLFLLPPVTAIPLLQGLSTANQAMSIAKLRKDMPKSMRDWFPGGPGPLLIGGLAAAPLGIWVLNNLSARTLTVLVGSLLLAYSAFSLVKPSGLRVQGWDGWRTALGVGCVGGVLGGFTANPGMPVIVWSSLRGVTKAASRGLVQPYIIVLQLLYLASNALQNPGSFGPAFWTLLALTLPVVLLGTLTGVWLYHRLSERDYQRASFAVLGLGALALIIRAL